MLTMPTSDKCPRQITSKCRCFPTTLTVTVTTQPYHTVFHFRHSSLIITLHCILMKVDNLCFTLIRLLFYIARQFSTTNFFSILSMHGHSQDKSSPSKMYSHGTSRPKSPPLLTGFPFMTTFPQLVCLFKTLADRVAFNLAIY